MHRIFLTAGLVLLVLALVIFSNVLRDPHEDNLNGNGELEIKPAPIHEVDVRIAESFPEQIFVYIKGGLSDGCTTFNDIQTGINGKTINITVTLQRPRDAICAQVYGYFEKNVALGSNFTRGQTYTVNVNGVTASFIYPK
jgi:hypothetical protein